MLLELKNIKKFIYHIITENNILNIGKVKFRDFIEVGDYNINKNIDIFVENSLNK